jgi:hypothetical protein
MRKKYVPIDWEQVRAPKTLEPVDLKELAAQKKLVPYYTGIGPTVPHFTPVLEQKPNKEQLSSPKKKCYRALFSPPSYGKCIVFYYIPQYPPRSWNPTPISATTGGKHVRCRDLVMPHAKKQVPATATIPVASLPSEYYEVDNNILRRKQILVGIHGAGDCHMEGAVTKIGDWTDDDIDLSFADQNNMIIVAPAFTPWFNAPVPTRWFRSAYVKDAKNGRPPWVMPGSQEDCCVYYAWWYSQGPGSLVDKPPKPKLFLDQTAIDEGAAFIHDPNMWDFIKFLNKSNTFRTDRMLNWILDTFHTQFPDLFPKDCLFGHSGGGQFATRYTLLYPERLARSAVSGSGSHLFPTFDYQYPYGLDCSNIASEFGGNNAPTDYASDLIDMTKKDWLKKFSAQTGVPYIISYGRKDTLGLKQPDLFWQGEMTPDRNINYYNQLKQVHYWATKELPRKDIPTPTCDPLLLEFDTDHGRSRNAAVEWLQAYWLLYPGVIPYVYHPAFVTPTDEWYAQPTNLGGHHVEPR